jgi:hypothetical protein
MSYEYSEYMYQYVPHLNIRNSSTRSHPSEDENHSKNCKCKRAFKQASSSSSSSGKTLFTNYYLHPNATNIWVPGIMLARKCMQNKQTEDKMLSPGGGKYFYQWDQISSFSRKSPPIFLTNLFEKINKLKINYTVKVTHQCKLWGVQSSG